MPDHFSFKTGENIQVNEYQLLQIIDHIVTK